MLNRCCMRNILIVIAVFCSLQATAQSYLFPGTGSQYLQQQSFRSNQSGLNTGKKWFVSKYSGLTAGMSFWQGGSANFIAAPVGLQLNRRINNNLYAFAGISAAPNYVYFNRAFTGATFPQGHNNLYQSGRLGLSSRASVGLMYVNDERTFSISGSLGVERNQHFPGIPPLNRQGIQQMPVRH